MKKYIESVIFILLFMFLIICFLANRKIAERAEYIDTQNKVLTAMLRLSEDNGLLELNNTGIAIGNIELATSSGDTVMLKKTVEFKNGFKLIFRYDKTGCQSCTQEITSILNNYLSEDSLLNNLIIIGRFNNTNDIRISRNIWNSEHVYGIVEDADFGPYEINKPHFIVIDNDCKVKNVFIPTSNNKHEFNQYLSTFSAKFSN